MTELSPAAIAVDNALAACIQLQGEIIRARPLAAAALEAAATVLRDEYADEEYFNPSHMPQRLDGIAAELKAHD